MHSSGIPPKSSTQKAPIPLVDEEFFVPRYFHRKPRKLCGAIHQKTLNFNDENAMENYHRSLFSVFYSQIFQYFSGID
jgi:hypothetical protein